MIGSIIGDCIGSVYEFENTKAMDFPLFTAKSSFTDDSVLTVATCEVLLNGSDYATVYRNYAKRFPRAGWGDSLTTGFTQVRQDRTIAMETDPL